jgi:hypothetical protein
MPGAALMLGLTLTPSLARAADPPDVSEGSGEIAAARAAETPAVSEGSGEIAAAEATPDPSKEAARTLRGRRFFVGASGGFAMVSASHPELGTNHLLGPVLGLQAGLAVSPRWTVSVDFTNFESTLNRDSPGELYTTSSSWLRPQAGCDSCPPIEIPAGSTYSVRTTMHLSTLSPRVEVTPFGADGLYLGASAGLAFVGGLDSRVGGAGTGRAGYRFRPAKILTLAIEGGVQGQMYADASAALVFAAAQGRLHF